MSPLNRIRSKLQVSEQKFPAMNWERCFAKSGIDGMSGKSVYRHSLETVSIFELLRLYLPETVRNLIPNGASFAAGGHDCGKISPGFQNKYFRQEILKILPNFPGDGFQENHAIISEAALKKFLNNPSDLIPLIGGYHHGFRKSEPFSDNSGIYGGELWSEQRQALLSSIMTQTGKLDLPITDPVPAAMLAGMVCAADWIASDEHNFPGNKEPAGINDLRDAASEAVKNCGWQKPQIITGLDFEDIFSYKQYSLQKQFCDQVKQPGLYILEAPMGCGKTEAALFAAYRLFCNGANQGLYFALPTRITSNKIHERVQVFLNKISADHVSAKLTHGTAWLSSGGGEFAAGHSWFTPSKRALLLPFGVGTVDQALLGVLNVKHFFLRLFGLAGKVVIFDEVHSYDLYTGTLLDLLCSCLLRLNCSVIILSATLTSGRRRSFLGEANGIASENNYPVAFVHTAQSTVAKGLTAPESQIFKVRSVLPDIAVITDEAIFKARTGCCTLLIANTVADAQKYFSAIVSKMHESEFPVGLLHSRFPVFRREEIEHDWLDKLSKTGSRPSGCILVATQVVEQSVDIDADYLITELAPSDMMLQRIGRLWRHRRQFRPVAVPEVTIISAELENTHTIDDFLAVTGRSAKVYAPYVLWRSRQLWRDYNQVTLPGDIRKIIEATYSEPAADTPEFVLEMHRKMECDGDKLRSTAKAVSTFGLAAPALSGLDDHDNAPTRWGQIPQTQVLLLREISPYGSPVML